MGVFNKTPYTNFHELNLNWIIKKIKEVAADNAYFKQFFKTIEDEHILGVVTKVTENNNNTVKTDYLNESTQQMDSYTVYNKTGTDGAISGAVTPIATRVTNAEGRLDDITSILNTIPRIQVFHGSVTTDNDGYVNINEALGINQMQYMYLSCEILHTNYYAVKTGTGSLYAANYIRVYNANNQVAQKVTFDIYVAVIPYTK